MASLRSSAIPVSDPASGLRITEIFTLCRVKQMPLVYRLYLFVSQVALYVVVIATPPILLKVANAYHLSTLLKRLKNIKRLIFV